MLDYLNADPKPYVLQGRFDPGRGEYIFVGKIITPIGDATRWGVVFGDVLHNFRSALDRLVCQLVLLNTGRECTRENQFPICSNGARYWSIGRNGEPSLRDRQLKSVADEHKAIIDALQPYRTHGLRPNQVKALAGLHDFSNIDKHRVIHPSLRARGRRSSAPAGRGG